MRVMRGLAALVVLLAGLVGLPWLLVVLTAALAPALAAWSNPAALLSGADPVAILLALLLLGAWLAWSVFLVSVIGELIALVSGHRIEIRLPGGESMRRLAAGLLISVVALVSTTQASSADPAPPTLTAALPSVEEAAQAELPPRAVVDTTRTEELAPAKAEEKSHLHVVERGDDLWSLAQQYYGSGSDWRRIAAANPHRLTGGPDRLQVGWRLVIPGIEKEQRAAGAKDSRPLRQDRTVVVRRDDTLSAIAEREYGAQRRWPIIWNANRHQLEDPDELTIGMRLVVPHRERWNSDDESDGKAEEGKAQTADEKHSDEKQSADRQLDEKKAHKTEADDQQASAETKERRAAANERRAEPAARPSAGQSDPGASTCADRGAVPTPRPTPSATSTPASPTSTSPTSASPTPMAPAPIDPAPPAHPPHNPPPPDPPPGSTIAPVDPAVIAAGVGSAGSLLAAALITGLALRRRQQLQTRPVGRRILHPSGPTQQVETALGHRARPIGLRTLDLATRAISAHCHHTASALPALTVATVADDRLDLRWSGAPAIPLPPGFQVQSERWVLDAGDVDELKSVPGLSEAVRPYPALVTLGLDAQGRPVVADLETLGLLRLDAEDPLLVGAALTAMALELSFSPWAEEMILTLVGPLDELPDALGRHNVSYADDVDALLARLESRAVVQRELLASARPGQQRVDPDLADPWAPEIILINQALDHDHEVRLHRLLTTEPRVTMAAVLPRTATAPPGWTLRLDRSGSRSTRASLEPLGLALTPQLIETPAAAAILELVRVTGSELTTPAPWWSSSTAGGAADPDPPPDNVSYLELSHPRRFGGWAERADEPDGPADSEGEAPEMSSGRGEGAGVAALHPTLLILGPVELLGATGPVPPRAAKQCLEYCGWLLEHPGATAQAMASALVVAEGTRRSNMSRLRSWLGQDESGRPYLPDAYSGRIVLQDSVSSDWQRFQILTARGVDRASTAALRTALELVRGAPLADAAPGQWHWAEELRTDMISAVRDLGVELADRALADHDIDLARWAASRALAAAPGDELLLVARIRTEHQAGHRGEVERLTLQIAAQARHLGVDLAPETVSVLQQVMEGRVRARMA